MNEKGRTMGGSDHGRFKTLLSAIVGKRLTYKELVGNDIAAATA